MALHRNYVVNKLNEMKHEIVINPFNERNMQSYHYKLHIGFQYFPISFTNEDHKMTVLPAVERSMDRFLKSLHNVDMTKEHSFEEVADKKSPPFLKLKAGGMIISNTLEVVGARPPYYAELLPENYLRLYGLVVTPLMSTLPCTSVYRVPILIQNVSDRTVKIEAGTHILNVRFCLGEHLRNTNYNERVYNRESIRQYLSFYSGGNIVKDLCPIASSRGVDGVEQVIKENDLLTSLINFDLESVVEKKLKELVNQNNWKTNQETKKENNEQEEGGEEDGGTTNQEEDPITKRKRRLRRKANSGVVVGDEDDGRTTTGGEIRSPIIKSTYRKGEEIPQEYLDKYTTFPENGRPKVTFKNRSR